MRTNVVVMLLLALVFGVAAVFLSNIWLTSQQPRAAAVAANQEQQDTIVVAAVPLRFGDRLTRENTRAISWPAGSLPVGGFQSRDDLLDAKAGDRQVLTPMAVNEPILTWKVTGPGQRATLSATLGDGMKAVSIRVNDVQGVAGFVLPGDRVDVLLSRNQNDAAFVDVLLQNMKVLAIDQSADDSKENATVVKAVTLEVSTIDAQKLTLAAGVGQLSLALREIGKSTEESTERVSLNDLVGGVPKPAPAAAPVATTLPETKETIRFVERPKPTMVQVGVMRGIELQNYDVPIAHN